MCLKAVQSSGHAIRYTRATLSEDEKQQLVTEAVRQGGLEALSFASTAYLDTASIMLSLMRHTLSEAVFFLASQRLQTDPDFVREAMNQMAVRRRFKRGTDSFLAHVSTLPTLCGNVGVLCGLLCNYHARAVLPLIPKGFLEDRAIVLQLIAHQPALLKHCGPVWQADRGVVTHAIQRCGSALAHACPSLRADPHLVRLAVEQNAVHIVHACEPVRSSPAWVAFAVTHQHETRAEPQPSSQSHCQLTCTDLLDISGIACTLWGSRSQTKRHGPQAHGLAAATNCWDVSSSTSAGVRGSALRTCPTTGAMELDCCEDGMPLTSPWAWESKRWPSGRKARDQWQWVTLNQSMLSDAAIRRGLINFDFSTNTEGRIHRLECISAAALQVPIVPPVPPTGARPKGSVCRSGSRHHPYYTQSGMMDLVWELAWVNPLAALDLLWYPTIRATPLCHDHDDDGRGKTMQWWHQQASRAHREGSERRWGRLSYWFDGDYRWLMALQRDRLSPAEIEALFRTVDVARPREDGKTPAQVVEETQQFLGPASRSTGHPPAPPPHQILHPRDPQQQRQGLTPARAPEEEAHHAASSRGPVGHLGPTSAWTSQPQSQPQPQQEQQEQQEEEVNLPPPAVPAWDATAPSLEPTSVTDRSSSCPPPPPGLPYDFTWPEPRQSLPLGRRLSHPSACLSVRVTMDALACLALKMRDVLQGQEMREKGGASSSRFLGGNKPCVLLHRPEWIRWFLPFRSEGFRATVRRELLGRLALRHVPLSRLLGVNVNSGSYLKRQVASYLIWTAPLAPWQSRQAVLATRGAPTTRSMEAQAPTGACGSCSAGSPPARTGSSEAETTAEAAPTAERTQRREDNKLTAGALLEFYLSELLLDADAPAAGES